MSKTIIGATRGSTGKRAKVAILGPGNVAPFMPFQPMPDRDSNAIGYAGVYSTFVLHAKRLGEQYHVDRLDILVELGRRKAAAGQEDLILDVTLELAKQRKKEAV